MEEQPEPKPRRYRSRALTETAIYAYSSVLVLYALACGWVFFSTVNDELSRTASVSYIIGLGLIFPVTTYSIRQAGRLQAKQSTRNEPGILTLVSWRPGLRLRGWASRLVRPTGADQDTHPLVSRDRAVDLGIAVTSVALFWAFWAGSLVAAILVPITVHWMRRRRA